MGTEKSLEVKHLGVQHPFIEYKIQFFNSSLVSVMGQDIARNSGDS
jgi:hypothetical protein